MVGWADELRSLIEFIKYSIETQNKKVLIKVLIHCAHKRWTEKKTNEVRITFAIHQQKSYTPTIMTSCKNDENEL